MDELLTDHEQRAALKRIDVLLQTKPLRGVAKREVDALVDRLTDAWNAEWPAFQRCIVGEIEIPGSKKVKTR